MVLNSACSFSGSGCAYSTKPKPSVPAGFFGVIWAGGASCGNGPIGRLPRSLGLMPGPGPVQNWAKVAFIRERREAPIGGASVRQWRTVKLYFVTTDNSRPLGEERRHGSP